ncbi:hypothetical protein scyTo_0016039, partial [Scyliorhinus torazame]|nr:hypothetical protein [Scyliorhinus torazame]
GCDSGFGHALAKHLDQLDFTVFAGVLHQEGPGAEDLRMAGSHRLTVLQLDVTNSEQIARTFAKIKAELGNKGSSPLPGFAAYGASKAALAMFSNVLRQELAIWGVKVVTVQPGGFKTGIFGTSDHWSNRHQQLLQKLPPDVRTDYGENYIASFKSKYAKWHNNLREDLQPVISAISTALMARNPKPEYTPGTATFSLPVVHHFLPSCMSDFFTFQLLRTGPEDVPDGVKETG